MKLSRKKPWHEVDGQLPPVGEECEVSYNMSKPGYPETYSEFKRCRIAGKDMGELWIKFAEESKTLISTECRFRPIQTEREKCVSEAISQLKDCGFDIDSAEADYFYCLYDAGMLHIKK